MSGKFVLFFLVAVCATQCFEARNVETRNLVDNIIKDIKDIVQKIEKAIHDLISDIPNMLKNLENKINETINKIISDIGNVVNVINKQIEKILLLAGIDVAAAKTCIDAEKASVDNLIQETTDAVEACRKVAEDRKEQLRLEMEELKTKAMDTIKEINSGVTQCLNDHWWNIIKLTTCMTGHLKDVKVKTDALLQQIKDTIFIANITVADVALTLVKCTANINANLLTGQKKILDEFRTCVDDIKSQQ